MKVGDLVEMLGSRGLIVEIKTNNYPPYQTWYKVHWQDVNAFDWVSKGTYKSFKKI
jgi:hypothetical protein